MKKKITLTLFLIGIFAFSVLTFADNNSNGIPDNIIKTEPAQIQNKTDNFDKTMKIGVNVFEEDFYYNDYFNFLTDCGKLIDFAVTHFDPNEWTVSYSVERANRMAETFAESDTDFIANFEFQNENQFSEKSAGYDWIDNSFGFHRLNLAPEFISALSSNQNFKGIMIDEFEHAIIHRNATIQLQTNLQTIMPVFPLKDTKNIVEQGEYLGTQITDYVDSIKNNGAETVYGENVYPVLYHRFAQSGITPNFKSQKETYSNIQYAIAAGAALEYDMPLSNCIDNWFMSTSPGHSADEMYSNFEFAYYSGVNQVYTESINVLVDDNSLTEHGEKFREFCINYKDKNREYDVSDFRPEIGIIRYDDSYYGQWLPVIFKRILFGNNQLKPNYKSKEYLKIFNILTHGESSKTGLSWGCFKLFSLKPHRSFASLNSTAVFDHQVKKNKLDSLKLCFLCGQYISDETLDDVRECVQQNGMTVVTTRRFAPKDILKKAIGVFCEVKDGNGKWLVIDSFDDPLLKTYLKPFIGNKGEMRLTFENNEVVMKISEDGNSFEVIQK